MSTQNKVNLISECGIGGCMAKLPPDLLDSLILNYASTEQNENLLVGMEDHDDAAVWKVSDEKAIISTTDFFPPMCPDPMTFGEIAATNALSDVYAMGGEVTMALNLVMFPSAQFSTETLREILEGGKKKVIEARGFLVGGHTIDDTTLKYGLAVTGEVHPDKVMTNSKLKPNQVLILTKPIGFGALLSASRIGLTTESEDMALYAQMTKLNRLGMVVMQKMGVTGATDITGFGLLGHALKMAKASNVKIIIDSKSVPLMKRSYQLVEEGCIAGGSFRNLTYVEKFCDFKSNFDYNLKMLLTDPQTSGGLLFGVNEDKVSEALKMLADSGYEESSIIGYTSIKNCNESILLEII